MTQTGAKLTLNVPERRIRRCNALPTGADRDPLGATGLAAPSVVMGEQEPARANRTGAHGVLQNTRVPRRVPAGADFAAALEFRSWLQRGVFFGAGAERVPAGADIASESKSHWRP